MTVTAKVTKSGHKACINCIDGTTATRNLIATGSDDQSIRLWDIRADRAIKCVTQCFSSAVEAVKFSVSDENVLYAASGRSLYSFDLRTEGIIIKSPTEVTQNAATDEINVISFNAEGTFIAVADDTGTVTIIDVKRLNAYKPRQLKGHASLVNAVAFNPLNSNRLVSGGFDYILNSWDLDLPGGNLTDTANISLLGNGTVDPSSLKTINPPFPQCLSFTSGGRAVAVALGDGSVSTLSI